VTVKTGTVLRPLRADAVRNREKILAAATTVFAARGLDVTFDDIAAAANVGVATVYRRFPDKDSLVVALFENAVGEIATLAQSASRAANSWDGFVWFLEEALERLCVNTGLRDVILGAPYAEERMAAAKIRIVPAMMALIERAQRDGYLRPDLVEVDMSVIEMMISSLGGGANQSAPNLWRRYLQIILDGLVVHRAQPSVLPPCAPEAAVLDAIRGSRC
jgi:AcrR family transcriptional regulator